nr:four helix bundle protein [Shewanella basaltis]
MRFEQLDVWKRASRLSCDIYKLTESVSNWGFKDQITRSGLSVPSNIADKSAGATFE